MYIAKNCSTLQDAHPSGCSSHSPDRPRIIGIGTSNPETTYTQEEVLDTFDIEDRRIRLMFRNSGIRTRHLVLPAVSENGEPVEETQGMLLDKHRAYALESGAKAILGCLERAGAALSDIGYLCCVTTTGLLTPGLSALLCEKLNLSTECSRLDIVGMGCNAGLNGLNATASWSQANPGSLAIMLCVEICSAAYMIDSTMDTAVVNSLFGDGAAAVALVTEERGSRTPHVSAPDGAHKSAAWPTVVGFASRVVPEAIEAMKFVWDDGQGKFNFMLAHDVPYVVGAHVEGVVDRLLRRARLRRSEVAHWIVHSGGKKVIDSVKVNLGLTAHDLRHTSSVLQDYGNMSSGSFLFSFERLLEEGSPRAGDYGVMMTMGPGATIETALLRW